MLVLQHLYNLSDDQTEYQIRDRYSFCRFLGLNPEGKVPDAETIWAEEQIVRLNMMKALFDDFESQLYSVVIKLARVRLWMPALFDVPKQHNTPEGNHQIKHGDKPERFEENPNIGCQKDIEARWTSKNGEKHFWLQKPCGCR